MPFLKLSGMIVKDISDQIINEMIPVVASEELADYIDVFCDEGFFTVDETERILMAGIQIRTYTKTSCK